MHLLDGNSRGGNGDSGTGTIKRLKREDGGKWSKWISITGAKMD